MTNVVMVVADDMRLDHLPYLPVVRNLVQDRGRVFGAARCNVALCQPSRVGFLTGQTSRVHGEVGVGMRGSVFAAHDNTVAAWLADAGVRCGLFGKYVNYYDDFGGLPSPRGWDTWRQFGVEATPEHFDVWFDDEMRAVSGRYQTEFLADEASAFVAGPEPWFAYVTPKHPHAPFSPHPRDLHAWSHERLEVPGGEDFASKPFWMQKNEPLSERDREQIQQDFRGRLRELNAVDRMVGRILQAVREAGSWDRTVVVFTSDNGVHQGEQGRLGDGTKGGPYDVGMRVPLLVSGPGFQPGPPVSVPTYPAQDVTATLLDLAGATSGLDGQAGLSLREVMARPDTHSQRVLLHEVGEGFDVTGDGITTGPRHELGYYKYFRYPSTRSDTGPAQFRELYDLAGDPRGLVSLARRPESRGLVSRLDSLLDEMLE